MATIRVHSKSGRFIALLPDTFTGGFDVVVTANGVGSFANSWPCSGLSDGPIRFEFDSGGNLVGIPYGDSERADGSAMVALSEDAQAFGDKAMDKRRKQAQPS